MHRPTHKLLKNVQKTKCSFCLWHTGACSCCAVDKQRSVSLGSVSQPRARDEQMRLHAANCCTAANSWHWPELLPYRSDGLLQALQARSACFKLVGHPFLIRTANRAATGINYQRLSHSTPLPHPIHQRYHPSCPTSAPCCVQRM
jgi:hypothetical protein